MTIPDFETIMLPFLRLLADAQEHSIGQVIESLAIELDVTQQERLATLPSGQQKIFDNRVGWARTYLKKAGLVLSSKRGSFRISDRGLDVLKQTPRRIDKKLLQQFPEFNDFLHLKHDTRSPEHQPDLESTATPEESLSNAYQRLRNALASDLLDQLKSVTPSQFEKIVIDVLVAMGYGGSREDARRALGGPHDAGIDGTIKEDPLGLEIVYVQAKKWDGTVGRPEIQKFAGALLGQRARKGIFMTTADFSNEASAYPSHIDSKIILIDGQQLAQYMVDHNVGVNISATYEIKRLDTDYFAED